MKKFLCAAGLVLVAGAIVAMGWFGPAFRGTDHPSVLLVTIDTLRADRLGSYGHARARTPVLDRLAAEGVRFERCYASAPVTRPSHATLLTGLEPYRHGVRDNLFRALPAGTPTLATILSGRGFSTGAVVAAEPLVAGSGLGSGFADYDDRLEEDAIQGAAGHFLERRADRVTDRALAFLEGLGSGDPFLLWVHYFDPHAEYAPPAEFQGGPGDAYDGEIAFVDRELGRLVEALERSGRLDDTIVVATADHGEGLGEHGEATHAYFVYDSTLRVPLLVRDPRNLPAGRVVDSTARLADVLPTVLDLAEVPVPDGLDGRSLLERIEGGGSDRVAYAESYEGLAQYGWRPLRTLRADGWKLVDWGKGRQELYRILDDRKESSNLLSGIEPGALDPAAAAAHRRLADELEALRRLRPSAGVAEASVDAERVRRHLSVSYAGLSDETSGREPPADPARFLQDVSRVVDLAGQGLHHGALTEIGRLLAVDPGNPYLLLLEGASREAIGDLPGARASYDSLLGLRPKDPLAARLAIHVRLAQGAWEEAETRCRTALAERPGDASLWGSLGYALVRSGRRDEGIEALERAVELDRGSEVNRRRLDEARGRQ